MGEERESGDIAVIEEEQLEEVCLNVSWSVLCRKCQYHYPIS